MILQAKNNWARQATYLGVPEEPLPSLPLHHSVGHTAGVLCINICQMAHRQDGCPKVGLEVNCLPGLYLGGRGGSGWGRVPRCLYHSQPLILSSVDSEP